MYLSIDRLEENYAVCEDDNGNIVNIDLSLLPVEVRESDVIKYCDGEYHIEKKEAEQRKNANRALQNKLVN